MLVALAGFAQANDPPEVDWDIYHYGDSRVDVPGAIDAAPQLTVYDYFGHLVLQAIEEGDGEVILLWGEDLQRFDLFESGQWVPDIETSEDAWGRPTFAGRFDADGIPTIHGFVDVSLQGNLVINLERTDHPGVRFLAGLDGTNLTSAKCECPFIGGSICVPQDCYDGDTCWGEKVCAWVQPSGPGGPQ